MLRWRRLLKKIRLRNRTGKLGILTVAFEAIAGIAGKRRVAAAVSDAVAVRGSVVDISDAEGRQMPGRHLSLCKSESARLASWKVWHRAQQLSGANSLDSFPLKVMLTVTSIVVLPSLGGRVRLKTTLVATVEVATVVVQFCSGLKEEKGSATKKSEPSSVFAGDSRCPWSYVAVKSLVSLYSGVLLTCPCREMESKPE